MSRTANHARNVAWEYLSSVLLIVSGLISRTIFIKLLGTTVLGYNTLFASVFGVLSVIELGIGPILNTQLYRPVARGEYKQVAAIVNLYEKVYRIVSVSIIIIGFLLVPIIRVTVKTEEELSYFWLYYGIYLITSALNYLTMYKFSVSNAKQKTYLQINIETIFQLITYILQIVFLLIYKSFLVFLLVHLFTMITKNLFVSYRYRKRYSFIRENRFEQIDEATMKDIKRNLVAGGVNKLTDVAINQTDSIIISSVVGVSTLGVASNYLMLRGNIERFTKPLIDNMGPIVGNFVSIESTDKKQNLVKILQFISFWIYGFCSICFLCLATPFVKLWLGNTFMIPGSALLILSINFMLSGIGDRPYNLYKNSHGVFYDDWYLVLSSAVINLLASVLFALRFGLTGVFLGMTASIVFSIFIRPTVFYTKSTGESLNKYYSRIIGYLCVTIITGIACYYLVGLVFSDGVSITSFFVAGIMLFVFINIAWVLLFHRKTEFKYVHSAIKRILSNARKRR